MSKKVVIKDSDLRSLVFRILREQAPEQTAASADPPPAVATPQTLDDVSTQAIRSIVDSVMIRANDLQARTGMVARILGGPPALRASGGGLIFASQSDQYPVGERLFNNVESVADYIVKAYEADLDGLNSYITNEIVSKLNEKFSDGMRVDEYIGGQLSGRSVRIPAPLFLYMALVFSTPTDSPEGSLAAVTYTTLSDTIAKILLGSRASEGLTLGPAFMQAVNSTATGAVTSLTSLNSTISTAIISNKSEAGSKQEYRAELLGQAQAPGAPEAIARTEVSDDIVYQIGQIAEASRQAISVGNQLALMYVQDSGPIADSANDIAESIFGVGGIIPDVLQNKDELELLAQAILDAYDHGLLVLDSAPATAGNTMSEDELAHKKDQFIGLAAAFWGASRIYKTRMNTALLTVPLAAIGAALVVRKNIQVFRGSLRGSLKDQMAFSGFMKGVAKLFFRVSSAAGAKFKPVSRADVIEKEIKALEDILAAAATGEKKLNTQQIKEIRVELEKLIELRDAARKENSNIFQASWSSLWEQRVLDLIEFETSEKAKIQSEFNKLRDLVAELKAKGIPDESLDFLQNLKMDEFSNVDDFINAAYKGFNVPGLTRIQIEDLLSKLYPKLKDASKSRSSLTAQIDEIEIESSEAARLVKSLEEARSKIGSTKSIASGTFDDFLDALASDSAMESAIADIRSLPGYKDIVEGMGSTSYWFTVTGEFIAAFGSYALVRGLKYATAAGPSSLIISEKILALNRLDENDQPVAVSPESRIKILSDDGDLDSAAQKLVSSIKFRTAKFLEDSAIQASIDDLMRSCSAALESARTLNSGNIEAQIEEIRKNLKDFKDKRSLVDKGGK